MTIFNVHISKFSNICIISDEKYMCSYIIKLVTRCIETLLSADS